MKNIVILVFFIAFCATNVFGQKQMIYGNTSAHLDYKYAYLYDSDTRMFETTPVIDHKFIFKLDKPEKPKILILSFNNELLKTYNEVLESSAYKGPKGSRLVALEDTVKITVKDNPKDAVVEGKILNKAIDEMNSAIFNKDFDGFFEKHPDSPISILFLKVLSKYSSFGTPLYSLEKQKLSFAKLSDRLKNSDEGKELSKKLQ